MSVAFPNLSRWLWSGKKKHAKLHMGSTSSLNTSHEPMGTGGNLASNLRSSRKKGSQEEGKIDKELDGVIVPSDGGCSSESESDASDWSIGWSEPHASGFLSEDEIDGGFGVLVRCYGGHCGGKQGGVKEDYSDNNASVPELYSADSQKYMEQWLSSLQEN